MDLIQLGARIRELRLRRRLKQQDIANALTLSAQAVSKWERGENAPDIALLPDLATILGVTVDWLLVGPQEPTDALEATIFCTSINQFATRSANMSSMSVATWINGVFYTLTEAVLQQGGVPIKYVGDGFLCFFSGNNHAQRALMAAKNSRMVVADRHLVITLHSGEIYLGSIGHPDYSKPDITGDSVNTAFLTMAWVAQNFTGGLGITDAVARQIADTGSFVSHDSVSVQGLPFGMTIFEIPDDGTTHRNL